MLRTSMLVLVLVVACSKKEAPASAPAAGSAPTTASASASLQTFWKWFTDHAAALRAEKDLRKTMEQINVELDKASPGVFTEIGADGDKRTLVLSADGKKELFPAVQQVYAARPTVDGWTIVAFRQRAKPGEKAFSIELNGKKIDPAQVKFVGTPDGAKVDVVVFIPVSRPTRRWGRSAL